ncbi:MAG: hypothetical protein M1828_000105 [Chrysothrix sp. TS-e1954]|nr:MAG: hypothetical protein M1828_000105 [Chrysothrix sp. TS-e1954]
MSSSKQVAVEAMEMLDQLDQDAFEGDAILREQALAKARILCSRLETPWDSKTRMIWLQPAVNAAIKTLLQLGAFACLNNDSEAHTPEDIARQCDASPELLRRLLKLLASTNVVKEVDANCFAATPLSFALQKPGYAGGFVHLHAHVVPTMTKLPDYLSQNSFKNPSDAQNGPWQYGKGTELSFYQWLASHREEGAAFNALMGVLHEQSHLSWVNIYPPTNLLHDVAREAAVKPLVVDVGGGIGRDMENLRQALNPKTLELIVQDLPNVVEQGRALHPEIKFMGHDFFTKQPIQGAAAYFMHSVLHDWPDDKALEILYNLKAGLLGSTILSMMLDFAAAGVFSASIAAGVGRHIKAIPPQHIPSADKMAINATCVSFFASTVTKIAVASLLTRIFEPSRRSLAMIWGLAFIQSATTVISVIMLFTQCTPSEAAWNPMVHGKCWSPHVFEEWSIFASALAAVQDLVYGSYPAFVISKLNMEMQKKIALAVVFAAGAFFYPAYQLLGMGPNKVIYLTEQTAEEIHIEQQVVLEDFEEIAKF